MNATTPLKTATCLAEESLHAVLAGDASPAESAHLATCGICQAELRRLEAESTILQFPHSTLALQHSSDLSVDEVPSAIGKYIIVGLWDQGPAWTTYRGLHAVVHREVLVQVAHASLADEAAGASTLAAAARPWMTRQPHVATVLDVGTHASRPFLVVEYDGGPRLDRIPPEDFSLELARGLAPIASVLAKVPVLPHPLVSAASLVVEVDDRLTLVDWAAANLWGGSNQQSQPAVRVLARLYADLAGNQPLPALVARTLDTNAPPPSLEELASSIGGKPANSLLRRIFG